MKLEFGGYEVEIKAKFKSNKKNSKEAVMYLLNNISLAYFDAAQYYSKKGFTASAEMNKKKWREIVDAIEAENFFG